MIKSLAAIAILVFLLSESEAVHWSYSPRYRNYSPSSKAHLLANKIQNKVTSSPLVKKNVNTITTEEAASEEYCKGLKPETKIQFPGDANKYIVCHFGETFDIMSCPHRLVFNTHSENCENSHKKPKGCEANPCQNEGKCVDLPLSQFRCECPTGFSGRTCEKSVTCNESTCGPHGVCMQMSRGSPINHYCICDNGLSYGIDCDLNVESNPCLSNEADLHSFPSFNSAIYVQCEGHIPHLRNCAYPLIYSHEHQRCDWR